VKAWDDEMFDVVFMVEPDEVDMYTSACPKEYRDNGMVSVFGLPDTNLGVGLSRAMCLEHAAMDGLESIIMSDDDVKPSSGMDGLIDVAADPLVLGITSWYSYLDLMLGIKGKNRNDVIICPSSIFRIFGLNVQNVIGIGNYDEELRMTDDADLMIRGIVEGFPWMIHLGAKSASMGARWQPGGIDALEKQASSGKETANVLKVEACDYLQNKFPDWVRRPREDKISFKWRVIYDENLPEWKHWSPLHGGNINNYMGEKWKP
jgi:hypothetical protein